MTRLSVESVFEWNLWSPHFEFTAGFTPVTTKQRSCASCHRFPLPFIHTCTYHFVLWQRSLTKAEYHFMCRAKCGGHVATLAVRYSSTLFLKPRHNRWAWVVNATPRPPLPRERPGTHCTGGWVVLGAGLDRCGKSRPHRDSIPGPSIP